MITFLILLEAVTSFLAGYYYRAIEQALKDKNDD